MVEQYPGGTAYHEAGHAVVAWSLGLPVGTINIRAEDAGGGTEIGPADHLSLVEQIAVCSAGHAAEQIFDIQTHDLASFNDQLKILNLIEVHGVSEEKQGPAFRDEGHNFACAILESHKNKLINLAERLVESGSVNPSEFLHLMRGEEG